MISLYKNKFFHNNGESSFNAVVGNWTTLDSWVVHNDESSFNTVVGNWTTLDNYGGTQISSSMLFDKVITQLVTPVSSVKLVFLCYVGVYLLIKNVSKE